MTDLGTVKETNAVTPQRSMKNAKSWAILLIASIPSTPSCGKKAGP